MCSLLDLMLDESLAQSIPFQNAEPVYFPDMVPVCVSREKYLESDSIDIGSHYPYYRDEENKEVSPMMRAHYLLTECLYADRRTRSKAERALDIIVPNQLTGFHICQRGLVHFPDLLGMFLDVHREKRVSLPDRDMSSMFARCLESVSDASIAQKSLQLLFDFKGDRDLVIKLLPGRYSINEPLYQLAVANGVSDSYYDIGKPIINPLKEQDNAYSAAVNALLLPKYPNDIVTRRDSSIHDDFRDAYHLLLYGQYEDLQSLIVRWDVWGDDRTTDAARSFYQLCCRSTMDSVKMMVNMDAAGRHLERNS